MLGNLSIRAKLIVALLVLAAAGGFAVWKAVTVLQETHAELARVERAVADLRGRSDGTAAAPIERAVQTTRATAIQAEIDLVVVAAIALVSAFVVALALLLLGVALPIGRVSEAARNLAKGDLWTDLPDDTRTDEAGGLAGALKSLKRAIIEQRGRADLAEQKIQEAAESHAQVQHRDRLLAEEIKRIAESTRHDADQRIRALETALREATERHRGELQRDADSMSERRQRIDQMSLAFERSAFDARRSTGSALDSLSGLAEAVVRSGTVATGSHAAAAEAAGAAEHSLQAAGKRADALGIAMRAIVDRARGSARGAAEALGQARSTDIEIQALAEAAQKIGDIVGVIQAIAQQTHLLALNASIEASRAGMAGKGFQVVAGEVKSLADQTARATDQVTRQIAGIQDRVARSVEAIRGVGDAVGKVALTGDGIAASAEPEGVAMVELGHHLDQATVHAQSAGRALQPLGEAAAALTRSTCAMQEAANVIARRLTALEGDIARYLDTVRGL